MARIEVKKEKLSSVIWTWIVVGVLSAVVITGLVLGIIYLVELGNEEEEKTFEEQYPTATLITYEDLNQILEAGEKSKYHVLGNIYVLVYSPDYESFPNGKKITDYVNNAITAYNAAVEADEAGEKVYNAFYVLNVTSEDNEGHSISEYANLSSLSTNYPYLLVISAENGEYEIVEDGIVTSYKDINNTLHFAFAEETEE